MFIDTPADVDTILDILEENGYPSYVVGGCVRDFLLGVEPHDWDITTAAAPDEVHSLLDGIFNVVDTGVEYGTVTAFSGHDGYEITTFRTDGEYADGRRPEAVAYADNVEEDLSRRDLTINAIAWSKTYGLADPYNGETDLDQGLIRCVGNATQRFTEDGLRVARAIRFAARLGFDIEPSTASAIRTCSYMLDNVSAERKFSELEKILSVDDSQHLADILWDFPEVFCAIVPELAPTVGCEQPTPHHSYDVYGHSVVAVGLCPQDPIIRLAALLHDIGKPSTAFTDDTGWHAYGHAEEGARIAERALRNLKTSSDVIDEVTTLISLHEDPIFFAEPTPKAVRRFLRRCGSYEIAEEVCALKEADILAHSQQAIDSALPVLHAVEGEMAGTAATENVFTTRDLDISGYDLMEMGMEPGPEMGQVLNALLDAVVDGEVENNESALRDFATTLI